jgi:hypothetical protein
VRRALISAPYFAGAFSLAGLVVCDTLTGKAIFVGSSARASNSIGQIWGQNYSSPTAFVSNAFTTSWAPSPYYWLIVVDDGAGNVSFYLSSDPEVMQVLLWSTTKSSSYLGASGWNYLGFMITPLHGAVGSTLMAWDTV